MKSMRGADVSIADGKGSHLEGGEGGRGTEIPRSRPEVLNTTTTTTMALLSPRSS